MVVILDNENYTFGQVQFNYPAQATKYYYLTDSSGYPSANYQVVSVGDKVGLVVPETRADSASIGKSSDYLPGR